MAGRMIERAALWRMPRHRAPEKSAAGEQDGRAAIPEPPVSGRPEGDARSPVLRQGRIPAKATIRISRELLRRLFR
jgi:hypothetical protein